MPFIPRLAWSPLVRLGSRCDLCRKWRLRRRASCSRVFPTSS